MENVQKCSILWSEDSETSLSSVKTLDDDQSLLLAIFKSAKCKKKQISTRYDFPTYQLYPGISSEIGKLKFPKEIERGKYEYKIKLKNLSTDRLVGLGTQLKWRLQEGVGECYYEIGVTDEGEPIGLEIDEVHESINNFLKFCEMIDAVVVETVLLCVTTVRTERKHYVCEVKVNFKTKNFEVINKRVFLLGDHSVGKTTLSGVLTKGISDDGYGRSRMGLFNHVHEIKCGHTSSLAYHLIGFSKNGDILNDTNCATKEDICIRAHTTVSLIDSCGSHKYIDTTLNGLTCHYPHTIFLLIAIHHPISQIDFLKISLSWESQTVILITHCDSSNDEQIFDSFIAIRDSVREFSTKTLKLVTSSMELSELQNKIENLEVVPVIPISNVTEKNIDLIHQFLKNFSMSNTPHLSSLLESRAEFIINDFYHVPGTGMVVSGILLCGTMKENDEVYFGPINQKFSQLQVLSLKRFNLPCKILYPGQFATVAVNTLQTFKNKLKRGSYLLSCGNPELRASFSAVIKCKFSLVISLTGNIGLLYVGNFQTSAVINHVTMTEDVEDIQDITVNLLINFKSFYIRNGLNLIFKCQSHILVGSVIDTPS